VGAGEEITVSLEATPETRVAEVAGATVLQNVRVSATGAGMGEATVTDVRVEHDGAARAWVEIERSDVQYGGEGPQALRIRIPLERR
jgi:hypothetical protein